jgi:glycosyltransferase involved in cell wall biosynthesis
MPYPSAIFTIVSANYIAFAATLMQSVRRFHPDVARFIILSDALHDFDDLDLAAEIVGCEDLGIEMLANMQFWYSVIEFNTAVKPFTFRHLFETRGFGQAIYLDPDIQLYAPLEEVFAGLQDHSLVLTPHMTFPLDDGKHPSDLSIMKSGIYNLGFAAIKNDSDGCRLVRWWCDRLFAHCRVDIPGNLFTDQRWMDLAPAFVPRTFLLRHHSYNVAYWNIVHRNVRHTEDGAWQVDSLPLVFFHFSGIKPEDPTVFSKHQDRFTVATLGPVAKLCDEYRSRVLANGWLTHNKIPYAYGTFDDGQAILDTMRRWVLQALDDGKLESRKPIRLRAKFFDAPEDQGFAGGGRLTRFAYQFWRDRVDLQSAFNLQNIDGFTAFVAWFCGDSPEREGVPAAHVQASRKLRDRSGQDGPEPLKPVPPPWLPLSTDAWSGPARDAVEWLRGKVEFSVETSTMWLQRQAALLWELRTDLQHHFRLSNRDEVENFQCWATTDGMAQGSIKADLFTQDYIDWFDSMSSISRLYDGVPISRGMVLTRSCGTARDGMEAWRRFPIDDRSRLEQGFWCSYVAPTLFGWPAAMTASVRAYFDGPSEVTLGGYRFSEGMLAPHHIRPDVQEFFDLQTERGRWAYLCWLLAVGATEFGIKAADLCRSVAAFMSAPSDAYPALSRWAEFAYGRRDDLQAAFDLTNPTDVARMANWATMDLVSWLDFVGLSELVSGHSLPLPDLVPHRCFVVLSGDWSTVSGLGEDLRMAVASLEACGFHDYVVVDLPNRKVVAPDGTAFAPGTPVQAEWNTIFHNADMALTDWNTLRELRIEVKRVAGHWLWELERIPARWIHAFSFVDEIWASSRFVMSIFEAEKRRSIRLLHHAVTAPLAVEVVPRQRMGMREDATVFLFMFDFSSFVARKNPQAVIRAFRQAFPSGDEHTQLVIKTQNAESEHDLWMELTALADDPRIVLKNALLSRDEVISLVATANAFVSLHRSEGFGRGPAEAMLLGVPVIVTGYSGTADFTDASCACMVGYTMVPVGIEEYPGVEGQFWAEANVTEAARWMRWIHDQPQAAREMGLRGQQVSVEMFSPRKIGANILSLLKDEAASTFVEEPKSRRRSKPREAPSAAKTAEPKARKSRATVHRTRLETGSEAKYDRPQPADARGDD